MIDGREICQRSDLMKSTEEGAKQKKGDQDLGDVTCFTWEHCKDGPSVFSHLPVNCYKERYSFKVLDHHG